MKLNQKIKQLLKEKPALRSSDTKLILSVWMTEGVDFTPRQIDAILEKASVAESITRARRDVQKDNPDLQATEEVYQQRQDKMNRYAYAEGYKDEETTQLKFGQT